jgi:hypothetical protein
MCLGALPAAQQALSPGHLRGRVAAVGFMTVNLIGLGLGPTVVALVTDRLFHDPARLGEALAATLPVMLLTAGGLGGLACLAHVRLTPQPPLAAQPAEP